MASSGYEKGMTFDETWQADLKPKKEDLQRKQGRRSVANDAVTLHDNIHLHESRSG